MDPAPTQTPRPAWAVVAVGLGMASLGLVLVLVGQGRFGGTDAGDGLTKLGTLMAVFPLMWTGHRLWALNRAAP